MNRNTNTAIWAIIACLMWATAYASIKLGLMYDSPLHFAALRFIFAGLMILPFTVKPLVYITMIRKYWKMAMVITVLQTLINYSLFYMGLDLVPGAVGAIIVGSQPLVTAIVASVMNKEDKLTRDKIITIIFGFSGVILISAGRQVLKIGDLTEFVGVLMLLAANIAVASSNVVVSLRSKGMNPLVLSSFTLFTGGVLIYLFSIPVEGYHKISFPLEYWLILAWLSFMGAFVFSLWFKLLQRPEVRVSELNMWKFIVPVLGAVLSWLLIPGENPDWLTIAGMIITTSSVILFHRSKAISLKLKEEVVVEFIENGAKKRVI